MDVKHFSLYPNLSLSINVEKFFNIDTNMLKALCSMRKLNSLSETFNFEVIFDHVNEFY